MSLNYYTTVTDFDIIYLHLYEHGLCIHAVFDGWVVFRLCYLYIVLYNEFENQCIRLINL